MKKAISIDTMKRLAKLLTHTGESEQRIEFSRQQLCKTQAFEPYASFQRLDRSGKGYLTARDIANFMRDNGIDRVSDMCCRHLVKFFDSTGEGRLQYTDYLQIVLPCDQQYLRASASQRPTYTVSPNEFLPYDVERNLMKLVSKELKLMGQAEMLKQELAVCYDYNLDTLYGEIDDCNFKFIDTANLKRFLVKCSVYASNALLIAIIRRMDLDADARLNQKEFFDGIQPLENYTKESLKEFKRVVGSKKRRATAGGLKRPQTTGYASHAKSSLSNTLHNNASYQERDYLQQNAQYTRSYIHSSGNKYFGGPEEYETSPQRAKSPLRDTYSPRAQDVQRSPRPNRHERYEESQPAKQESPVQQQSPQVEERKGLSTDTEAQLNWLHRNCFREMVQIEASLEDNKLMLAKNADFTLEQAFNIFAPSLSSRLSSTDILHGFKELGVTCSASDSSLVVYRYDCDGDSRLGYWEFSNMLMPMEPKVRDDLERRRAVKEMGAETKSLLKSVMRQVIDAESMVESIRQNVKKNLTAPLRSVFDELDWLHRGHLTSSEFRRYFEGYSGETEQYRKGADSAQREMEGLIRRFNKDKLNGRVSLPEFMDELTPKCPESKY